MGRRLVPDLTVLVPCFNEAARIDGLVEAARAWAAAHPTQMLEFLCVDDGSTDDTRARLERHAQAWPALRVVPVEANGGKGEALRHGMRAARGRHVVFLDADLAVDLGHVDAVTELLAAGTDVVVGCRNVPGANIARPQRPARRWLGKGYLRLARLVLGLRVADVTCGFKGFRREVSQPLFERSTCRRWGIDAELLFLAQRQGLTIREVPVTWVHGQVTAVRLRRDVLGALSELVAVRFRHAFRTQRARTASAPMSQEV